MAQEDREAYIAWLRDEVGWHCNSRGCYEAFWDYDDSVTPDQMAEACANYEEAGFASPLNYLDESIMEKPGFIEALENELISAITRDAATAPEGVGEQWVESGDIWGDLESAGYEGIDANVEDLLSNSSFNVNVFFATEAEENFDMGSIVHAFGNDYRDPRLEDVDAEDLDNALSYLVNQQGHSIAEVYGNGDNAFIRSVREEIDENSSEAMSELCALVRMDSAVRKPARRMAASPSRGRLRHRVPPPRNWPRDATPAHRHEKTPPSCRYIEDHHGRKVGKHHGIRQEHSRRAATAAPRPR